MTISTASASVYTDLNSLDKLKYQLKGDSVDDLRVVAQQFEAIFIQQIFKTMREANLSEGLFESNSGDLYVDMLDKQMSLEMSAGKGIGLADMIVQQLSARLNLSEENPSPTAALAEPQSIPVSRPARIDQSPVPSLQLPIQPQGSQSLGPTNSAAPFQAINFTGPQSFIAGLWPLAIEAGRELGVAPQVLVAQAALETGWGQYIAAHENGNSSHNLFNIKAGANWTGNTVTLATTELKDGTPSREYAAFRVYDSYRSSFQDYVNLVKHSPRYRQALASAADPNSYLSALQAAGYATDPEYAAKILRIASGETMENVTLNLQDRANI